MLPSACNIFTTNDDLLTIMHAYIHRYGCIERALGLGNWDDTDDFLPNVWVDIYRQNSDNKYGQPCKKFKINSYIDGVQQQKAFPTLEELCGLSNCDHLENMQRMMSRFNSMLSGVGGGHPTPGVICGDLWGTLGTPPEGFISIFTGVYPAFSTMLWWDTDIHAALGDLDAPAIYENPLTDLFNGRVWERLRICLEHATNIFYRIYRGFPFGQYTESEIKFSTEIRAYNYRQDTNGDGFIDHTYEFNTASEAYLHADAHKDYLTTYTGAFPGNFAQLLVNDHRSLSDPATYHKYYGDCKYYISPFTTSYVCSGAILDQTTYYNVNYIGDGLSSVSPPSWAASDNLEILKMTCSIDSIGSPENFPYPYSKNSPSDFSVNLNPAIDVGHVYFYIEPNVHCPYFIAVGETYDNWKNWSIGETLRTRGAVINFAGSHFHGMTINCDIPYSRS